MERGKEEILIIPGFRDSLSSQMVMVGQGLSLMLLFLVCWYQQLVISRDASQSSHWTCVSCWVMTGPLLPLPPSSPGTG